MASKNTNISFFKDIDWVTIILYFILVVFGAVSIYAASYDYDQASMFNLHEFSGKQFMWIGISSIIALFILIIDRNVYETYSYLIYTLIILLLIVTIFIAPDIKGSRSWIKIGEFSIQPAEFAKFATALALAKLFSSYNFNLNNKFSNYLKGILIVFIPIILILLQKETGSALIFLSLIFVFYREGMSGLILFSAFSSISYFIIAIKFTNTIIMGIPLGEFIVFILIMLVIVGMLFLYCHAYILGRNVLLGYIITSAITIVLNYYNIDINGIIFFSFNIGISLIYILLFRSHEQIKKFAVVAGIAIISIAFLFSVNYVFNNILEEHQQTRIKVALGIEEDLKGAGYNVNQSKIAIGSGGLSGKGFLNGTQTKLKYVPEQHTDFIFCTIGEEEGFLGTSITLLLFLILILRIIVIAERQPTAFGRVYAYSVASYLILHVTINIGMVIGLCPVIGIPLPFFSYGGSSLLAFTILLFILLKIDATRKDRINYY